MIRPFIAAGLVMLGTASGDLIENHPVDIKTVGAVGSIVLGGAWTLSRRFTRLEDRLEAQERLLGGLYCVRRETDECGEIEKAKRL